MSVKPNIKPFTSDQCVPPRALGVQCTQIFNYFTQRNCCLPGFHKVCVKHTHTHTPLNIYQVNLDCSWSRSYPFSCTTPTDGKLQLAFANQSLKQKFHEALDIFTRTPGDILRQLNIQFPWFFTHHTQALERIQGVRKKNFISGVLGPVPIPRIRWRMRKSFICSCLIHFL